ncbi:iron uptake porin [Alkalinema sp. FACHB-956]|uniref:iron uptake porin n=1 Tax=Alkalinema sp. FACHB-956 TaxID=2692768 RepID=UPI001682ACE6|nr:carbohydrate porin [Alkalinema sp. FACHB-956]
MRTVKGGKRWTVNQWWVNSWAIVGLGSLVAGPSASWAAGLPCPTLDVSCAEISAPVARPDPIEDPGYLANQPLANNPSPENSATVEPGTVEPEAVEPGTVEPGTLNQIEPGTGNQTGVDPALSQLPLVSELSDIQPSDWAYKAVKALVERYGIVVGYPDGTFRGDRPINRYEFAAILSQLRDRIEQFIEESQNEGALGDLATVRNLQNFYQEAFDELQNRLTNTIEPLTAELERQQFSTTTKLGIRSDQLLTNGTRGKATFVSRTRLNLNTSFLGNDLLVTQLEAGNQGRDAISENQRQKGGVLETLGILADGGGLDPVTSEAGIRLRKLYYSFQPIENLTVAVGTALPPSAFVDHNTFANDSGQNFISSFFSNNPLIVQNEIDRVGGAGVAVSWQVQEALTLRGLFVGADANDPTQGLFHDRYQGTIEAEYQFDQPITLRLQYTNGNVNGSVINAFGANAEWAVNRQFGVFARVGIGHYQGFNRALGDDLDLNPKTWAIGGILRNFVIPGSKAGLAIGQPFVTKDLGNATQTNVEAYFGLLLNDYINFSPSVMVLTNPDNRKGATVWQWSLRMTFEF